MTKYLWRGGKWVEAEKLRPKARVHVHSDWADIESPITGEHIHGRAHYERHLKEFGSHISEPGDVAKRQGPDREGIRAAMKRAMHDMGVR